MAGAYSDNELETLTKALEEFSKKAECLEQFLVKLEQRITQVEDINNG